MIGGDMYEFPDGTVGSNAGDCAQAWADEARSLRAENAKAKELIESAIPYMRAAMQGAEAKHDDPEAGTYMDGVQYEIMCECRCWLDKALALKQRCA